MPYIIETALERFSVDDAGNIGRPSIGMAPSEDWKLLHFVRNDNFGRRVEHIPFPNVARLIERNDWLHKNGRPKWTVRDRDHGTVREWGRRILRVREV